MEFNRELRWPPGGVVAACEGNINKMFCLIVFVVLVSYVVVQIWDQRNIIKRGGSDYESEGGFVCSLIVLIRFMAADVVISTAERCPAMGGSGQRSKSYKMIKRSKND